MHVRERVPAASPACRRAPASSDALASCTQEELLRARADDAASAEARRARNSRYRAALEAQIGEAEGRRLLDDVFMTTLERQLNSQLLDAARAQLLGPGA